MPDQPNPEKPLGPARIAEILQVSFVQIYPLVREGELPAVVFRKSVRLRPCRLMNVADEHRKYAKKHPGD
jgi:hypothetical protein